MGWAPFILEAIDQEHKEVGTNVGTLKRLPSEHFKANFHTWFWFERRGLTEEEKVKVVCGHAEKVDNITV